MTRGSTVSGASPLDTKGCQRSGHGASRQFANGATGLPELENGQPEVEAEIGIEVRGNTSQEFPKKQYRFETWSA